jgi:isoleucyl-tRNA synthetase
MDNTQQKENIENVKSAAALREEGVLQFWKDNNIFKKSLDKKSPNGEPKKEFVFYDGPATANALPPLHSLVPRVFKDVLPRYKTMRGYHVRRKAGWDTHGLPVELQIEKKLGLKSKKEIEEYGVAAFNKLCRDSVWEYITSWNKFTERSGYWVDWENAYITYENRYVESVWSVLKTINDKGLLYKDYKVLPWCPRCGTALSSHELAQGYQDDKDLSVTAKFKVVGQENTYILAWTTTPWTLPGNVALAVGKDIEYVKVKVGNEILILAKARVEILTEAYEIFEELTGNDLVGLEYEPLYSYFADTLPDSEKPKLEKTYKVYSADFVTTTDGTGVVHTAVMYGQEDFVLGTQVGLPKHHLVGLDGKFLPGTGAFAGRFVKDEDVAVDVIKDLAHRGLLFKKEKYEHSYPHCWRCKTALIYYARDSWYIRMSDPKIKEQLIAENKEIHWEPSHIREGRFGEWLKDIKDWAISRERYWGTPLPVWTCDICKKFHAIGSIDELQSKAVTSGNKYFVMRHGETEHNIRNTVASSRDSGGCLTDAGKTEVMKSAEFLKNKKIDMIFVSPFSRTIETEQIVKEVLGLTDGQIVVDDRLHEMSLPMYEGKTWMEYHADYPKTIENFDKAPEGNESYVDIKRRMMSFLFEIDRDYKDKNILIVTHGAPAWLLTAGARMLDTKATLELIKNKKDFHYFENAEIQELPFTSFPHDENGNLDLHKPYIDEVMLVCECSGNLSRTPEVMDVWFDSGAMPFAQDHYPFENKEWVDGPGYPADFISEAIDQTRGWFYTLHAVGVLMGRGKAYKNVICLGHLLDASGKKMSKSIGNVIDPWLMMDKYGVDTLRLWMYSVNQPGESKNFDEKTVAEVQNKVFNLLYNVLAFYELYRDPALETAEYKQSKHILDQWIVARMNQLVTETTEHLDNFKLLEPVRSIRGFIDDLSTWYVRRSRDRIKGHLNLSIGDTEEALVTLYFILKTLAKVMAPFAPFAAEDIWQKLKNDADIESVHLAVWPSFSTASAGEAIIIEKMEVVRAVITKGLELRQKAGIKIRQPLASFSFETTELEAYHDIIKDELNVKSILSGEVMLDTHITLELRQEGQYRELLRAIQDMRKAQGLNASDSIVLTIETGVLGEELINTFETEMQKTVGARELKIAENQGQEVKIDDLVFQVEIAKM